MPIPHVHAVQVYYEDTDHSGFVYHPNFLKYFERAREHLLGVDELMRLERSEGVGFVVYKVTMDFKAPAHFGDRLEVRTTPRMDSEYRVTFTQEAWRGGEKLVVGTVQLVCLDENRQLVPLPECVEQWIRQNGGATR